MLMPSTFTWEPRALYKYNMLTPGEHQAVLTYLKQLEQGKCPLNEIALHSIADCQVAPLESGHFLLLSRRQESWLWYNYTVITVKNIAPTVRELVLDYLLHQQYSSPAPARVMTRQELINDTLDGSQRLQFSGQVLKGAVAALMAVVATSSPWIISHFTPPEKPPVEVEERLVE